MTQRKVSQGFGQNRCFQVKFQRLKGTHICFFFLNVKRGLFQGEIIGKGGVDIGGFVSFKRGLLGITIRATTTNN